jgi:hypothetical protein
VRPRGGAEIGHVARVVGDEAHFGALRQAAQPRDRLARHHLVGDEDVVDAAIDHRLGHADLRAGDPTRTRSDLSACHGGRAVGLGVRAQRRGAVAEERRHRGDVRLKHVEIDERRGCREISDRVSHPSGGRVVRPRAVASYPLFHQHRG